eukprot:627862-Ditylum_brightwellii.AAC.1
MLAAVMRLLATGELIYEDRQVRGRKVGSEDKFDDFGITDENLRKPRELASVTFLRSRRFSPLSGDTCCPNSLLL